MQQASCLSLFSRSSLHPPLQMSPTADLQAPASLSWWSSTAATYTHALALPYFYELWYLMDVENFQLIYFWCGLDELVERPWVTICLVCALPGNARAALLRTPNFFKLLGGGVVTWVSEPRLEGGVVFSFRLWLLCDWRWWLWLPKPEWDQLCCIGKKYGVARLLTIWKNDEQTQF